jgi:hypothetical protein
MIDWVQLFFNFLWLVGLALLLMIVSFVHWQTEQQQRSFWQGLAEPESRLAIAGALVLLGLGRALSAGAWPYSLSWGVLALAAVWMGGAAWQEKVN